jgi:hypothetical protein
MGSPGKCSRHALSSAVCELVMFLAFDDRDHHRLQVLLVQRGQEPNKGDPPFFPPLATARCFYFHLFVALFTILHLSQRSLDSSSRPQALGLSLEVPVFCGMMKRGLALC